MLHKCIHREERESKLGSISVCIYIYIERERERDHGGLVKSSLSGGVEKAERST